MTKEFTLNNGMVIPAVGLLAIKYKKTPAQILLKFLIQRGISVIPKASSPERMLENKDLFDFELTFDEISRLSCVPETGWSGEHPDMIDFSDRF